jgi:hypothetical protein
VNFKFIFLIHKLVKWLKRILLHQYGGKSLKKNLTIKQRKNLEVKMSKVLSENIKGLSAELQKILLDDMVTAFQNRINVLIRAQRKRSY